MIRHIYAKNDAHYCRFSAYLISSGWTLDWSDTSMAIFLRGRFQVTLYTPPYNAWAP